MIFYERETMDKKYKEYLKGKMSDKKIAIWGTGKYSFCAETLLRDLQINEYEYLDSDIEKQKNGYNEMRVSSPDSVSALGDWYILISVLHSDVLAEELRSKGLNEIDDFICVLKNDLYYYLFVNYGANSSRLTKTMDIQNFGKEGCGFSICCNSGERYSEKNRIIVYSFGIGEDLSFSQELSDKFNQCEIFAFDPTPKAVEFVKKYDKSKFNKFLFFEYGLSDTAGKHTFYLPKNPQYVSASEFCISTVNESESIQVEMRTLKQLMDICGHDHIDLLKLDIEGSEFVVIPQFLQEGVSVSQICVELHDRLIEDGRCKREELLELLNRYHYRLIHMSESGEELTFVFKE